MGVLVALWLILILWNCKYEKANVCSPFSKENTLVLKGICAIEIMLGHIGIATNSIYLYPNRKAGILFVGIFFALSGYGLMYSVANKSDYLDGFLRKRLSKILIPVYIVHVISVLIGSIIQEDFYQLRKIVMPGVIFSETNWYVWELIVLYVLFYTFAKKVGAEKCHWYILGLSILFIFIAYGFKIDNPWYGSTLCFWLGMIFFLKEKEFREKIEGNKFFMNLMINGIIVVGSIGIFMILGDKSFLGNVAGRNFASTCFVLCVIILLHRFRIGNKVSAILGKYSFEIFLIHFKVISICRLYIENQLLFAVCVVILTIALAVLFKRLYRR